MICPTISTVVLNWNRAHLLRTTLESYLATVTVPYELIVVDNASTDESGEIIDDICGRDTRHRAIKLKRNLGGPALNSGLRRAKGEFLHVSENDLEYWPGWDVELLAKFAEFSELGQLSPFGPEPETAKGEVWERVPSTSVTRNGQTVCVTETNITTTSVSRRQFWDLGFRWGSYPRFKDQRVKLPDDFGASEFVRRQGFWVAWNDHYVVANWGHNIDEWQRNLDYYVGNYTAKTWLGVEGLRQRLRDHGYDLEFAGGRYSIVKPG